MKAGWLGVVLLCAGAVVQAQGVDAAKRAKVEELFAAMRLEQTMSQMVKGTQMQTMNMVKQMPGYEQMNADQKRVLATYETKATALVDQAVGWKVIEPDLVRVYSESYSDDELNGLLAFYRSPVGQTMLNKAPEITAKSLQITQARTAAIQPQMQALMMNMVKELMGSGPSPAAAGAKPAAPKK